jgi:glucosylceramidase
MKSSLAWVGGNLQSAYYGEYANYFKNFLDAMKAQGINIWAITPQNEPENATNEPSMTMTSSEQLAFINNNLGPVIRNAGYTTKIIGYDHNCDDTNYPTTVANGSSYVDGTAFHLYAGSISALTTVKNATGKNVYFTEQYTGSAGSFSGDFPWHMQNVMIGSVNNWAKIALEWNLATNSSFGPHTPGGSNNSQGALTITGSTSFTRNVSYYLVAHLSKFVRPDAVRVNTSTTNSNLINVAFTSGTSKVLVVLNNNASATTFNINYSGSWVTTTLQSGSAATYVWN